MASSREKKHIEAAIKAKEPIIAPAENDNDENDEQYKKRLRSIWRALTSADAVTQKQIIADLDEKTARDLRKFQNPYKKPVFVNDKYKLLVVGMVNLKEKYWRRFTMTAMIGFLYRMLDEFEPADMKSYPSEDDPLFANEYNKVLQEFERNKPERNLKKAIEESSARIEKLKTEGGSPDLAKEVQDNFILRAKLLRYRQFYNKKDLVAIVDTLEATTRDLRQAEHRLTDVIEELSIFRSKLKRKLLQDAGKSDELKALDQSEFGAAMELAQTMAKEKKTVNDMTKEQIADRERMSKHILLAEDMRKPTSYFESHVVEAQGKVATANDNLDKLRKSEYTHREARIRLETTVKDINHAIDELKSEYVKVFGKTANTSNLDVEVVRYPTTPEEHDALADSVKAKLNIKMTREEYVEVRRAQVEEFLNTWFKYNPDNHVRAAWCPDFLDPEKRPKGEDLEKQRKEAETKHCRSLQPPNDSFFRIDRYIENNYSELRQATDDVYCERSDIEEGVIPYETFEGKDPEEVDKKAQEFCRKYAGEVDIDMKTLRFGRWNLTAPLKQNLEKRDFFTKENEILKRIVDRSQLDAKEGMKIVKQRAKEMKRKNEAEHGKHEMPDAVRKAQTAELEKAGAKSTAQLEKAFTDMEKNIPRDEDVSKKDELEVGVHVIKPEFSGRRRIRGRSEVWKFHTPTEKQEEGSVKIMTPGQFHTELNNSEIKEMLNTI